MSPIEITSVVANIVIFLSAFYISFVQKKRQFQHSVMLSCIERYLKLFPLLRKNPDDLVLIKYIELTNEELFYFQEEYIPEPVMAEWMDSIIDNFPIYQGKERSVINLNSLRYNKIYENDMIRNYPRLLNAFYIDNQKNYQAAFDDADINYRSTRIKLIQQICRNLNVSLKEKVFKNVLRSNGGRSIPPNVIGKNKAMSPLANVAETVN